MFGKTKGECVKSRITSKLCWTVAALVAVCAAVVSVLPFIFMVLITFKDRFELLEKGVFALPEKIEFTNYLEVLKGGFGNYFVNSVLTVSVSLLILLLVSAFASYPLARFQFRLGNPIFSMIVACMSIPIHITLIPIFKMSTKTGIYDSIWALVGPYVALGIPISVFILTSFMKQIPREIEEAASIDGCGKYRMFFTIILPMAKAGLSTLAIYNGVSMWNEFMFAYTLTQSQKASTLPLAVWQYQGQYSQNRPMIMTVLTLSVLPMIILYIFAQDKLVKGMTAGAVKG